MFIKNIKKQIFLLASFFIQTASFLYATEDDVFEKFSKVYDQLPFNGFSGSDSVFEEVVKREPTFFSPEQRLAIGDYLVYKNRLDQAAVWFKAGFVDPALRDMRIFDSFKITARHLGIKFDEVLDKNDEETLRAISSILERQKEDSARAVEGLLVAPAVKASGGCKRPRDEEEAYLSAVCVAWYIIDQYQKSFAKLISSVVLQKALLASDILSVKNCGKSITHSSSVNWDEGPVYKDVWHAFKSYTGRDRLIRVPEGEMRESTLGETQKAFVDKIICEIRKFDNKTISDLSHEEALWLATPKNAEISAGVIETYYKDHPSPLLDGILGRGGK